MSVQRTVQTGVNKVLRPIGVQVVRGYSTNPAISPFLPARQTRARARRAGQTVGDYLDSYSAEPGATADTVQAMLRIGGLDGPVERVCEIGPGSGRYLDRVVDALRPSGYEVYETAPDWLHYLQEVHPDLVVRPADGLTLRETPSSSIDLVHAHKLFGYVPFITTLCYLDEMARVVRPGGVVAFDVITDDCLDETATKAWLTEPAQATIYSVTPRSWILELLARRDLSLLGSRFIPLSGARTELLVFGRRASA